MPDNRRHIRATFADQDSYDAYEPHLGQRGRTVALALLLLAVAVAVYLPGIRKEFIAGEDDLITRNNVLRAGWEGVKAVWIHPTLSPHYQPLAYSALMLEFQGMRRLGFAVRSLRNSADSPQGYLAVNLLLHAANVLLLWTLLRKLELPGALAAAMLFAVHPINVETVAWINQQPLLLCGVFDLSGLLVYLRYCQVNPAPSPGPTLRLPETPWMLYGLALLLMGAAVTSHAAAVTMPLVALVLIWWERGRLTRNDLRDALPLLIIGAVWLCIAVYADVRRAAAVNEALDRSLFTHALVACRALWIYLAHLIVPWRLTFAYPKWDVGWLDALGLVGLAGAIAAAWWALKHFGRGPMAVAFLMLLALVPMFLLRTDLDRYVYVSDHLAYLAAMVLAASLVGLLAWVWRTNLKALPRWVMPCAAGAVVLVLAVGTLLRLPDFRSSEELWNSTLRRSPSSALAHNQLGMIHLADKDTAGALAHFQAALVSDGNDPLTHVNIGAVYEAENQTQKAIDEYYQALALSPDNPEAHFGLAKAFASRGNSVEALREYQSVLTLRPDHLLSHNNLGLLHAQRGETELAVASYERAIAINPGFMPPYINLANLQYSQGQIEAAAATLMRAVRIDPANYEAYMNAGAMVAQLAESTLPSEEERIKLNDQAVLFFGHATRIKPDAALAHKHLGMALLQKSRLRRDKKEDAVDGAVFHFTRAVELEPENAEYQRLLKDAKLRQRQAASQ